MVNLTLEQAADRAAAAGDAASAARHLEQLVEQRPNEAELWVKLAAMRRALGSSAGALEAIEKALALEPLEFSALLARGMLLNQLGDPRAAEAMAAAVDQAPEDAELPAGMAGVLALARKSVEDHRAAVEKGLRQVPQAPLEPAAQARVERFIANRARRTRHFHQEPTEFHYPGLPEVEVHPREEFPQLTELEANFETILAEFLALMEAEATETVPYIQYPDHVPLRQWKALNRSDKWAAMHLIQNGQRIEANARHCPRTMEILDKFPQPRVAGASPNAMFSLLAPHTRIPPHTGVANTRLVCHLALIVPPNCGFRVGATTCEWRAGEAFVFDDTIEHEAWNDSDQLRVVMIFDLWPPALSEPERAAVAAIIGASGASFTGAL